MKELNVYKKAVRLLEKNNKQIDRSDEETLLLLARQVDNSDWEHARKTAREYLAKVVANKTMSLAEFAEQIAFSPWGNVLDSEEEVVAKNSGIVVVYGYSDDTVCLRGAIKSDLEAWTKTEFLIDKEGPIDLTTHDMVQLQARVAQAKILNAGRNIGDYYWEFDIDVPFETVPLTDNADNGETYSTAIVFYVKDLEYYG